MLYFSSNGVVTYEIRIFQSMVFTSFVLHVRDINGSTFTGLKTIILFILTIRVKLCTIVHFKIILIWKGKELHVCIFYHNVHCRLHTVYLL